MRREDFDDVRRESSIKVRFYMPSVREGIHGSTEYGRLSINAQIPKIAECKIRNDSV
jgi:hypothetical protein